MDEVQETQVAIDALAALPDDASNEEVVYALSGLSDLAVSAALHQGGGGGGSQPPVPFVTDTDPLLDPPVGAGALWVNPSTDPPTVSVLNFAGDSWVQVYPAVPPTLAEILNISGDADQSGMTNLGSLALTNGGINLGDNGSIADCVDFQMTGDFEHQGTRAGFYGHTAELRTEVPATPTAQDIVDALVTLGLVTQAAP